MLSPVLIGTLIQTGVVILLCLGFTFTYMVEKFPNFAHTSIATIGTIVSFSMVRIYRLDPYASIPIAMLVCGALGVGLYLVVVRPIRATGAHVITLTFAFFALTQVFSSLISMYSYWFLRNQGYPTSGFNLAPLDFKWGSYPGVLLFTIPTCFIIFIFLYFFLTRLKQGIALRAVAEDEALASSLGINVFDVHLISWFITGVLAGLAGALIPLWRYTGLGYNDEFLVLVMAGSVIGGLNSVAGAVIGGFLAGVSQKVLGAFVISLFGVGASEFESLYPMIFIVVVLMLVPQGIVGVFEDLGGTVKGFKSTVADVRAYFARLINAT